MRSIFLSVITPPVRSPLPPLLADVGEQAAWRYVEFFAANIPNPDARRAAS